MNVMRLQKNAARVILDIQRPQDTPSSGLLQWMNVNQRRDNFISILVYKINNKSSPGYPQNSFKYVKDGHQFNSRSAASRNLCIPRLSSKTGQRYFQCYYYYCQLEIVFSRAASAFDNLLMGCVFDINTVHKTVEKLKFQAFH